MPIGSQSNAFSSGQFNGSSILKFIQSKGVKVLWRAVTGVDYITTKDTWEGGKERRYNLVVDAGGLAFSGLNQQQGSFALPDRAYAIQGSIVPKFQTMTMYFDRVLQQLSSKSDAAAYIKHMELEYVQKTAFQKSFMALQQMGDGTGRFATPVGIGPLATGADGGTATTFTLTSPGQPLKIKMSSLDTAVGSAAHLMEGSIVSLMFPSYDEAVTGTTAGGKVKATCIPRYLTLGFIANSTASFFDAFRVIRVDQDSNEIYVVPARKASPDGAAVANYAPYAAWDASQHVQQGGSSSMWCAGTGTVTVSLLRGRDNTNTAPSVLTAIQFNSVFAPTALTAATDQVLAAFIVHPGFVPNGKTSFGQGNYDFSSYTTAGYINTNDSYDAARVMLGIGWDTTVDATAAHLADVDVGYVSPYLMTGLETLLMNSSNRVHGIDRASVQQILPTIKDQNGRPLTFNSLFAGLTSHYARNRDKDPNSKQAAMFSMLSMSPFVYSHILSLSEQDRRLVDGTSWRGTGAKKVVVGNQEFELDSNSSMRQDRILGIPKGALHMAGGTMDPVELNGQNQFLTLNSNSTGRTNAVESYYTIMGECYVGSPDGSTDGKNESKEGQHTLRDCFVMRNYTINLL
jgi:hypothetical protein